jgi:hypothetical protein
MSFFCNLGRTPWIYGAFSYQRLLARSRKEAYPTSGISVGDVLRLLALAARMHVAERERVVAVELPVPEAVGVGEDKAPVVLAGKFADERFVGLLSGA